ncbi:MAG: DNA mismatch repair protein MutS [Firmicutes bacterium]|nr:DNA mismatch repair protein MutS [Bacillota bacterium]
MTIVTPMMRQYQAAKQQYADCLLFFRMGDFYEMFGDDAICASRELNIVLTARDSGNGTKTPMCGVPYHAVDNYLARLIEKGYKVAICEQTEDPKQAKGLVKREVIRVVTPGTIMEDNMLEKNKHNYLAACWREQGRNKDGFGLAYTDISTGEFAVSELRGEYLWDILADELSRIDPAELILPQNLYDEEFFQIRMRGNGVGTVSRTYDDAYIKNNAEELVRMQFQVASLEGLGLQDKPLAVKAAAAVLDFLAQTQKKSLEYIDQIHVFAVGEHMILDQSARRNLELTATMRNNQRYGSLLWVVDDTLTPMGGRLLKDWLENPLLSSELISRRLDGVEELTRQPLLLDDLRNQLKNIYDLERIVGRICYGSASPRDLIALRNSLYLLPGIYAFINRLQSPFFMILFEHLDLLEDICQLLEESIADEPPVSAKDSGVIKEGYHQEVDQLRSITGGAKNWLLDFENQERERTGIRTLKVGFNKVFGYYIEVSKGRLADVPEEYTRKQTLVNGERFITAELKAMEDKMLSAGDKLAALEYQLFCEVRDKLAAAGSRIRRAADVVAHLDAIQSLASVAIANDYCKPQVNDGKALQIRQGRHPVIEKIIGRENYIENDADLDGKKQMMLITGPNMAGKSTYMRQVALIALMARTGSFVPAKEAVVGYIDRIFTRVGAADDLAAGQSTFMVEMNETSNILRNATENSLIILDEIGRGTSTFDGLSIAWAVAEYLCSGPCRPKTLFATHYHELTALADNFPEIRNYSISVKERNGKIIFLRKIVPGGTDRSYGIQVARLAGLPAPVIKRAKEVLSALEAEKHVENKLKKGEQLTFADILLGEQQAETPEILEELARLDLDGLTPLAALTLLSQWKKEYVDER